MNANSIKKQYGDFLNKDGPNIIRGAENADLEEIKAALLENPNCINEVCISGLTALHYAACDGMYSIVDFLCDQPGVDIGVLDIFGRTPYLLASIVGRNDIHDRIMKTIKEECQRSSDVDDANDKINQNSASKHADTIALFKPKPPSGFS